MVESAQKNNEGSPKTQFQAKLTDILYTPVSVENIGNFADVALEKLIALNEAVVDSYTRDFEESDRYLGSKLEDQAYATYGLENLNDILDRIIEVRDMVARISSEVHTQLIQSQTVITPPDSPTQTVSAGGAGTYEAPKLLNRLVTLAYILERDFELAPNDVGYVLGSTTDTMMRKEPYVRVSIPDLNRVVYVCDEEGNASYVFDTEVLEQLGVSIEHIDESTKNQRNAFIRTTPTVGRRIIQSPEWRMVMKMALETPFDDTKGLQQSRDTRIESEFQKRERGPKLDYEVFKEEVRRAYKEAGSPDDVANWYKTEYPKHRGWPASPEKTYKGKGWVSWPAMVGKEVVELLSFEIFIQEVQTAYEKAGSPSGVRDWYETEYKKHPGWPAGPEKTYKGKGWVSRPAMVGKEVVELLSFEIFIQEVQTAYEKAGSPNGVRDWYETEYKKHPGWPAGPHKTYKNRGWVDWPTMVGKEIAELLPFTTFKQEVTRAYEEAGSPSNIQTWYTNEYPKRSGWPASPGRPYKDKGWVSWPAMVGKEVVELLSFETFKNEVRVAYEEAGSPSGVNDWYRKEYKKHLGWPAAPDATYKDKGWVSWQAMVGKEVVELLSFEIFIQEVQTAYEKAGSPDDVANWYKTEYPKHRGWPASPEKTYKGKGWVSWPAMVGK